MPATRAVGFFLLVLTTGCTSLQPAAPQTGAAPRTEPSSSSAAGESAATAPPQAPKKESSATDSAKPAPPLDLATLEKRLRETEAIGVLTKLTIKNQVDDIVDRFREVHQKKAKPTSLRQPYDLLVLKVLSLLQDTDPTLAKAIVASREAIWNILADPVKFSTL